VATAEAEAAAKKLSLTGKPARVGAYQSPRYDEAHAFDCGDEGLKNVAPRAELPELSVFNRLDCQTFLSAFLAIKSIFPECQTAFS